MHEPRYYDIRRVKGESTLVEIDNEKVESASTSFFDSAVVRALGQKGWGVVSLDHFDPELPAARSRVLEAAVRLAGTTTEEGVELAPAPVGIRSVPSLIEDPGALSLEEKTEILAGIEHAARLPGIVNTRARYMETTESVSFFDSSGNERRYEVTRCGFSVVAVASRNGVMQMGRESSYTIRGFNMRDQQSRGKKAAEMALALLDAKAPKGGVQTAVLDPELGGVFAHEAVGHASEGDLVKEGSSVLEGKIGQQLGSVTVTIIDDPTLPEFGFEPVDAEGVAVASTGIIRDGVLRSYLHNRETLAAVGHGMAGHARAQPGDAPLVRMSNTFIENGDAAFGEIIEECKNGILLKGSRGGQVDPGRGVFQFNAEYGYLIRDGECGEMVRDVSLSGDILSTLHSIAMVGDDRIMHQGHCGKGGQSVPVSDGAPHVLLLDALVGGHVS